MSMQSVEYALSEVKKFLEPMAIPQDAKDNMKIYNSYLHKNKVFLGKDEDQSGSEGEDDREYMNNQMFRYKHKTK